jgi:putative membrane protein
MDQHEHGFSGERNLAVIRQHPLVLAPTIIGSALMLIATMVVLVLMPGNLGFGGVNLAQFKVLGAFAVLVILLYYLVSQWLRWRYTIYSLTDRRIIFQTGILSRFSESIALDRIQDIRVKQPVIQRMIGLGDIEIESAGRDGAEVLHFIPAPQDLANALNQAIEDHRAAITVPVYSPGQPPGTATVRPYDTGGM